MTPNEHLLIDLLFLPLVLFFDVYLFSGLVQAFRERNLLAVGLILVLSPWMGILSLGVAFGAYNFMKLGLLG